MKTVEERLKSYEPLWENWTYTGEFLGEGAMSSVFEIESTAMGFREIAALKIVTVKKNHGGQVIIPENALNEIKILRTLSGCPNIVHYHDSTQRQIFDENGELSEIDILIKMEKLKPLSEGDKLSESQIIKLGKDMCCALIHAAEHGIIHRDIKPQNIFVDAEGTYKLGDFGIAKIVSDFSGHFTMNIGTLAYTAPEVQGSTTGVYGVSADIYSLGLVLYVFANNGCMPFANTASSLHEAITKRLTGSPFPSPRNGSKNLKSIIMRACSNDLKKRYKHPQEMLDDLELLSTGGKKLVIDPFATLDANVDVSDAEYAADVKPTPSSTPAMTSSSSSTGGGLIIRMNPSKKSDDRAAVKPAKAKPEPKPEEKSDFSMGGDLDAPPVKKSEASKPKTEEKPAKAEMTDKEVFESRVKINIKKSAVTESVPEVPAESPSASETSTPEKTEESSFFSAPDFI